MFKIFTFLHHSNTSSWQTSPQFLEISRRCTPGRCAGCAWWSTPPCCSPPSSRWWRSPPCPPPRHHWPSGPGGSPPGRRSTASGTACRTWRGSWGERSGLVLQLGTTSVTGPDQRPRLKGPLADRSLCWIYQSRDRALSWVCVHLTQTLTPGSLVSSPGLTLSGSRWEVFSVYSVWNMIISHWDKL